MVRYFHLLLGSVGFLLLSCSAHGCHDYVGPGQLHRLPDIFTAMLQAEAYQQSYPSKAADGWRDMLYGYKLNGVDNPNVTVAIGHMVSVG